MSKLKGGPRDYVYSYAAGINEYIKTNPLPLQFYLAWTDFESWIPEHS